MLEDRNYKSILTILNDNFDELCYEIIQDAELQSDYRELMYIKKLLLTDFPVINKIELSQAVNIKDEDLKSLKEYHEINDSIKKVLMKEAYFRGIKDMILILARANLFKENQ
ncbi:hypothetical protein DWV50_12455 [Coprobacillus sp. AF09-1A]|nr:hypothetical protein DWV50_12455 [Coprobacillus sp. AF09-1A]